MTGTRQLMVLAAGALALAAAFSAGAGNFGVSPIRVELDRSTKSALVTVSNDDTKPLAFQVRALEWSQEPNGADRYTETTDLVYFPQQFKVAPNENRVVRVGYKVPATQAEKTYRLLAPRVPPEIRYDLHLALITHGRTVCKAQRPRCTACVLLDLCPYGAERTSPE